MQVITRKEFVQTSVKNKEIKFEIDQLHPEVMIKIVSDMYPDARRTVTTEYVQNALDSHYEAGCPDVPIQVTLPTPLNPVYKVRDFGIGMTRETIENTFRYVFRSTKSQSDEVIGGFGLGKLVFGAYSGVMDLLLYSGTQCEHYVVRLKDGDAGLTEIATFPSNAPRGVEVRIPVYEDDCDYFEAQCRSVYALMPVRPVIMGRPEFWADIEQLLDTEVFFQTATANAKLFYSSVPYQESSKTIVLIGGIPFPIKRDTLMSLISKQEYQTLIPKAQHSAITTLLESPLVLSAKPGDLEVVPSRDNIKYNRKSAIWLGTTLIKIHAEFEAFVKDSLLNAPSFVEVWQQVVPHVESKSGITKTITTKLCANVPWNNVMPVLGNVYTLWKAAFHKATRSWYSLPYFATRWRYVTSSCCTQEDGTGVIDFTKTSPTETTRYTYSGTSQFCDDFLNFPLLKDFGEWVNTHIEKVGVPREARNSETVTRCIAADLRAKLLPLLVVLENALLDKKRKSDLPVLAELTEPWKVIVVDLDECTLAKSSRILNYNVSEKFLDKTRHIRVYTRGIKTKDLIAQLQKLQLGELFKTFLDIDELETPPANVGRSTRRGASNNSSSVSEFGANSLFTFSNTGRSPSDSFNDSFWRTATNEDLQAWKKDKSIRLFFVPVSAYKPVFSQNIAYQVLNTSTEGYSTMATNFTHTPSGFTCLIDYMFNQLRVPGETTYKVVGVKTKTLPKDTKTIFQELDEFLYTHLCNLQQFTKIRSGLNEDDLVIKAQLQSILLNYLKGFEASERFKTKEVTAMREVFLAFKQLVSNFKLGLTPAESDIVTNAFTSARELLLHKHIAQTNGHYKKTWYDIRTLFTRDFSDACSEFSDLLNQSEKLRELFETKSLLSLDYFGSANRSSYGNRHLNAACEDALNNGAFLIADYIYSYNTTILHYNIRLEAYDNVFDDKSVAALSDSLEAYLKQCAKTFSEVKALPICNITNHITVVKNIQDIEDSYKPNEGDHTSFLNELADIFATQRKHKSYLPFLLQRTLQLLLLQASNFNLTQNDNNNFVQTDSKFKLCANTTAFKLSATSYSSKVTITHPSCLLCMYGSMLASILHEARHQSAALFNILGKADAQSAFNFLTALLPSAFDYSFSKPISEETSS